MSPDLYRKVHAVLSSGNSRLILALEESIEALYARTNKEAELPKKVNEKTVKVRK